MIISQDKHGFNWYQFRVFTSKLCLTIDPASIVTLDEKQIITMIRYTGKILIPISYHSIWVPTITFPNKDLTISYITGIQMN